MATSLFISVYVSVSRCFVFPLLLFPPKKPTTVWLVIAIMSTPILTATLTSAEAHERNTLRNGFIILLMQLLYNGLTHFCVYCRVFSVASRVVGGYCRSFLQLLVAGRGCRQSAGLQRFWGGGFLAVTHVGRFNSQQDKTAGTLNATPSTLLLAQHEPRTCLSLYYLGFNLLLSMFVIGLHTEQFTGRQKQTYS